MLGFCLNFYQESLYQFVCQVKIQQNQFDVFFPSCILADIFPNEVLRLACT